MYDVFTCLQEVFRDRAYMEKKIQFKSASLISHLTNICRIKVVTRQQQQLLWPGLWKCFFVLSKKKKVQMSPSIYLHVLRRSSFEVGLQSRWRHIPHTLHTPEGHKHTKVRWVKLAPGSGWVSWNRPKSSSGGVTVHHRMVLTGTPPISLTLHCFHGFLLVMWHLVSMTSMVSL